MEGPYRGGVAALWSLAPDLSPLRGNPNLQRLTLGNFLTGLGTQAALVALPYQVYVESKSAFLTGLLGAAELVPLAVMSLIGGALADRFDRRKLLALVQVALIVIASSLAALAFAGDPPLPVIYVLAGLLAGAGAMENAAATSIVPNLVPVEQLRSALALNFGLYSLTMVIGPAAGGLLIGALGVGAAYTADAISCLAMVVAVLATSPQPPRGATDAPLRVWSSIREGLSFVKGNSALKGSFAIDLLAMTFGMPRALFPVLSLTVYHAGAGGTGALLAAVSAGATVAALTTGWLKETRRLGLVVIWAVVVWGGAIAAAGLVRSLWPAMALLALAGAADSVSAVCRTTINQTVTPDRMRGRMSSVFSLVVTSGPRFGDVESGAVAAVTSPRFSVTSGGLACVAGVGLIVALFPALARYDAIEAETAARDGALTVA
jgi:MFS family permease